MNSTSACNKISTSKEENLFHLENVRGEVGEKWVQETAVTSGTGHVPGGALIRAPALFLAAKG